MMADPVEAFDVPAAPRRRRFKWFWLLLIVKVYVAGALFMLALLGLALVQLFGGLDEGTELDTRGLSFLVGLGLLAVWLAILRMALPSLRRHTD